MAITFNENLRYAAINFGINRTNSTGAFVGLGFGNVSAITVYGGGFVPVTDILDNWGDYNSLSPIFLAHYNDSQWTQGLAGSANFTSISVIPTATAAINTGSATWAIIWPSNPLIGAMGDIDIPSEYFLVCSVSTSTGDGIIKFDLDTMFSTGTPKPIASGAISATTT